MNKEEREWILNNVEEICIDTKDVDEISIGLEHLSIFASEAIKDLATTVLDLQSQLDLANKKLEQIKELVETEMYVFSFNQMMILANEDDYKELLSIIGGE